MSLEVIETGEVVEPLSRVEAERLTARIADKLDSIADNLEQVLPLIGEALTRDAWKALDYADPSAYVSERFAGALTRLPRAMRVEVVKELSAAKMSTRAIAPIVGASFKTVANDVSSTVQDYTVDQPRISHGMDGKTRVHHPRPEPEEPDPVDVQPRQPAITNQFSAVVVDINRAMAKLVRITESNNYRANHKAIAELHRSDLTRTINTLQTILEELN